MSVDYLVYVSQAAPNLAEADLAAILDTSRDYNTGRDITGLLIYAPDRAGQRGSFMQLLEGDGAEIDALRERIFADRRHHTKVVLERGTKPARAFSDWSMAFRTASPDQLSAYPAFADLGAPEFHRRIAAHPQDGALQFLEEFWTDGDG